MANAMQRKPMKVMAGPSTILRKENMSGLKPVSIELPLPLINMNPRIISSRQPPIIRRFILGKITFGLDAPVASGADVLD